MKGKLKNLVLLLLFYLKMRIDYRKKNERMKKESIICRQHETLSVYEAWLELNIEGKAFLDFLKRAHYSTIGIYGLSRLGRQVYNYLTLTGINIECIIDNYYSKSNKEYKNTPCYSIDSVIPAVDLYIVTVPDEVHQIKKKLFAKTNSAVQSLQEIMFIYRRENGQTNT